MTTVQDQSNKNVSRTWNAAFIIRVAGAAALLLLAAACALFAPPSLRYTGFIVFVLTLAVARFSGPCIFLFKKHRAGITLLNLGRLNEISNLQIFGSILVGVLWLALFFSVIMSNSPMAILWLCFGLYNFATAVVDFIVRRESTFLTEKGIYAPKSIVLWNRIESRQWLNQHKDARLVLKLKNRPWPFDEAVLSIPVSFKAEVDRIIAEKCAG